MARITKKARKADIRLSIEFKTVKRATSNLTGKHYKVGIGVYQEFTKTYREKISASSVKAIRKHPLFGTKAKINQYFSDKVRSSIEGAFTVIDKVGGIQAIINGFAQKGLVLPKGYIADKMALALDKLWTYDIVKFRPDQSPEITLKVLAETQEEVDNFFGYKIKRGA